MVVVVVCGSEGRAVGGELCCGCLCSLRLYHRVRRGPSRVGSEVKRGADLAAWVAKRLCQTRCSSLPCHSTRALQPAHWVRYERTAITSNRSGVAARGPTSALRAKAVR